MSIYTGGDPNMGPYGGDPLGLPVGLPTGGGAPANPGRPIPGVTGPDEVTRTSTPSPVGTGSSWSATLQALALGAGKAIVDKYFSHDSRSTKTTIQVNPGSSVDPLPGRVDGDVQLTAARTTDENNQLVAGLTPTTLAIAAVGIVVLAVALRR